MATGVLYAPVMCPCAAMECVCKICTALGSCSIHTEAGHKGHNLYIGIPTRKPGYLEVESLAFWQTTQPPTNVLTVLSNVSHQTREIRAFLILRTLKLPAKRELCNSASKSLCMPIPKGCKATNAQYQGYDTVNQRHG